MARRLFLKRRPEMGDCSLVVVNFEGVLGDIFKDNIWQDTQSTLHLRKGVIKGLKLLISHFQVVLFFHSPLPIYDPIITHFTSHNIAFDAIYSSENSFSWLQKCKGRFKKPLKYSEHVQNYSIIALDFNIQHEILSKMLILTSIWLENDEYFHPGINLIVKSFHSIPQYLCKAVPLLDNHDSLLPVTLAVPDPRITNAGDSFMAIAEFVYTLSQYSVNEECSWMDGFARIRAESNRHAIAFESTAYQFALAKEKVKVSKGQVEKYVAPVENGCICPNELKGFCKINDFGKCDSLKKMKGYLIAGKEVPRSMLKNKFIIFNTHQQIPYKIIEDKV